DNVLIRKKRNLHSTSDIIYLAGIWNDTYKNVKYLFEKVNPNKIKIIHYEDLIQQTEQTVREICEFFEVRYFKEMLNYQVNYKKYLEIKRSIIGEAYYQRTLDFQSSLLKPISKDKINLWKKELNTEQLQKIATVCGNTARYLQYDLYEYGAKKLNLSDKWQLLKANMHRYQFLKLYLKLPIWLKIWIKKIRNKKPMC
ncbi:MAG: hypothetical protein D6799_07525, partial [Bacteroidetes bacterium]